MGKHIIINARGYETRVAVLENTTLVELYIDRPRGRNNVGNIYNGIIARVLPGMQSAFVDIGLERTAFLYVTDVFMDMNEYMDMFPDEFPFEIELPRRKKKKGRINIEDMLKEGQEIMVQIVRGNIGTKGAKITSWITLPGRYLVMMPFDEHIGVSRKIENVDIRLRLKKIIERRRISGYGFIARTACETATETEIVNDINFLVTMWEKILNKKETFSAPALLHRDLDISLKVVRDLMSQEVQQIVVDSEKEYEKVKEFVSMFMPQCLNLLKFYDLKKPIFQYFGIEPALDEVFSKVVWLKSGGFIQIDELEAFTAVDVNTGKYVGKRDVEETLLRTNMEAVKEIAYQLRIRNIGGIVVIDFIDMENKRNQRKVVDSMLEELKKDRATTTVLGMSDFGLVEMTRKKVSRSLLKTLTEPCFYCEGKGVLKSRSSIIYEILRGIEEKLQQLPRGKNESQRTYEVVVHPLVADTMLEDERHYVEEIEQSHDIKIIIRKNSEFYLEYFEINEGK
ncbi:MAG TPA: Rne/Rng family ribonuclease [bacterium]